MTDKIFPGPRSALMALALAAVLVLSGCGGGGSGSKSTTTTAKQPTSSTTPPRVTSASFKGVTIDVPKDWTVVEAATLKACPPATDNVIILGDLPEAAKSTDCLGAIHIPKQVLVRTLPTGQKAPATLLDIGSLKGFPYVTRGPNGDSESALGFPNQQVAIVFTGDATTVKPMIQSSVRPFKLGGK